MHKSLSSPDWTSLLTPMIANSEKSFIREIFKTLQKGGITSFAGGLPDVSLFPYKRVQVEIENILKHESDRVTALNYGPSEGYKPLREWISGHMQSLGVNVDSRNVLITSGGQQALDLVCRSMISPGDTVIVAAPTYLGALQILRTYGANIVTVPTDADGPDPVAFEDALRMGAKFAYFVSDFSNPSGQTISTDRRRSLTSMARRYGMPIVDDAAYQQLRFAGDHIAPLIAFDQATGVGSADDRLSDGGVIHIGTFSKTMMPGMRVGWMVAPRAYLEAVVVLKQATDLHSPLLNQMATFKVIDDIYDAHIPVLRQTYKRKRDCMITAMRRSFPQNVEFNEPEGGMFVWLTLPEGSDSLELVKLSMAEAKVAYIPGSPFFAAAEEGKRHCRLSFSSATEDKIEEGIGRFGDFLSNTI